MSEIATCLPFPLVRWLSTRAGFPATRLPARAELLLCIAAAAAINGTKTGNAPGKGAARHPIERRNIASDSSRRALALRRSRVHFKCDNSAKV
ncbi:MAG: hypothetical protein LBK99_02005 [Opitutaceae bacterium]|nr:hypothetical protein [Opitutaceae bacterium]